MLGKVCVYTHNEQEMDILIEDREKNGKKWKTEMETRCVSHTRCSR